MLQLHCTRPALPWKNGLGVQYDIISDEAEPDSWSWRLATADLSADAPFSFYPGVLRHFCIGSGRGVTLTIDGTTHTCDPMSITTFSGEATVSACLIDGPSKVSICKFNLLTRLCMPQPSLYSGSQLNGPWFSCQLDFACAPLGPIAAGYPVPTHRGHLRSRYRRHRWNRDPFDRARRHTRAICHSYSRHSDRNSLCSRQGCSRPCSGHSCARRRACCRRCAPLVFCHSHS